jgi:hypothetical protein
LSNWESIFSLIPSLDSKKDKLDDTKSFIDKPSKFLLFTDQTIVHLLSIDSLSGIGMTAKIPFSENT